MFSFRNTKTENSSEVWNRDRGTRNASETQGTTGKRSDKARQNKREWRSKREQQEAKGGRRMNLQVTMRSWAMPLAGAIAYLKIPIGQIF